MSVPSRVQPGTPAGGQFAATTHLETDVGVSHPEPSIDQERIDDLDSWVATWRQSKDATSRLSLVLMGSTLRKEFPSARYLRLENSDQGEYMVATEVTDAGENTVSLDLGEIEVEGTGLCVDNLASYLDSVGDGWSDIEIDRDGQVDLDVLAKVTVPAGPDGTPAPDAAAAFDAWSRVYRSTDDGLADASLRVVAADLGARHPQARYLELTESDQGPYMGAGDLLDEHGELLDEEIGFEEVPGANSDIDTLIGGLDSEGTGWRQYLAEDSVDRLDLARCAQIPRSVPMIDPGISGYVRVAP